MKTLFLFVLCSLSLPAFAETAFSTDDFVGSWRIEHYDEDNRTTSLTEVYFHESGAFYSQSMVSNGSTKRYYDSGGNWAYEGDRVRLDYSEWSDSAVETMFLQFENFSSTYLSFRRLNVDGEQDPALYEAHRFEGSSFEHGC
ncbi:MAG: hypothetical protein K0U72_13440 [Gammaproteobacteria bacterium]|nr:hypothetical protein [Gammaproteobacteria bacterium]